MDHRIQEFRKLYPQMKLKVLLVSHFTFSKLKTNTKKMQCNIKTNTKVKIEPCQKTEVKLKRFEVQTKTNTNTKTKNDHKTEGKLFVLGAEMCL